MSSQGIFMLGQRIEDSDVLQVVDLHVEPRPPHTSTTHLANHFKFHLSFIFHVIHFDNFN